jgi:hypothetical protein
MVEKMFKKAVLLNKGDTSLSFAPLKNYKHAKNLGAVALSYREAPEAGKHYPIFFVKDSDGFTPIALLGVDKDHNLFTNKSGEWSKGKYVPALIRLYPFIFSKTSKDEADSTSVSIAFDSEYEGVNAKDGFKFFNEDQSLTEFGEKIMGFAGETFNSMHQTKLMGNEIDKLGLLSEVNITFGKEGEKNSGKISGIHQIDAEKLNKLSDEELLTITKNGSLHLIYNHLDSLSNFDNLVNKLN